MGRRVRKNGIYIPTNEDASPPTSLVSLETLHWIRREGEGASYMHISKYLGTHIIPAHSHHPNTHITQHVINLCDTERWGGERGRMGRRESKDGEERGWMGRRER